MQKQIPAFYRKDMLLRQKEPSPLSHPDAEFREFLTAKLALWGWDGTNEGVPAVLEAGLPGNTMTDNGNGTVTVSPGTGLPAQVKDLTPMPAGIGTE